jgi:hypothetical protein
VADRQQQQQRAHEPLGRALVVRDAVVAPQDEAELEREVREQLLVRQGVDARGALRGGNSAVALAQEALEDALEAPRGARVRGRRTVEEMEHQVEDRARH